MLSLSYGLEVPRVRGATARGDKAISYLPIHVPIWASLPNDLQLYPRPLPLHGPPDILFLDDSSSCLCSLPRTLYSPFLAIQERTCTIYTTTRAHQVKIQLQRCPTCAQKFHRFIGPEPRNLGLFNFNNQIVFAHDLLDEYTSAYTSSETPFAAWVLTVSCRYEVHQSCFPFVNEKMFRSAWFAYSHLQRLETDMHCPKCGPDPQDTIWDGVTLAFSQKHQLPSLRPPTMLHEKSLKRQEVRYRTGQQLIPQVQVRKAVRFVIEGRSLIVNSEDDWSEEGNEFQGQRSRQLEKKKQDLLSRVEAIPDLCAKLKLVNESLSALFTEHYGVAALLSGKTPPVAYKRLFVQVSK